MAIGELARTSNEPAYHENLQVSAESLLRIYQLLGLIAAAEFGWVLLQTGIVPSWLG